MSFVTKLARLPLRILSAAVGELQSFYSAAAAMVAGAVSLTAIAIVGTVIAIAVRTVVIAGRDTGSRSERSSNRGHGVLPITALVLAAAIALSPLANDLIQVQQCVWNGKVFLCRWRTVDPPPAPKRTAPATTNSASVNRVV